MLILFPFTTETYAMVQDYLIRKPIGYRWPDISDFWFTAVTTAICMTLENVFQFALFPWYYSICKEKQNEAVRRRRSKKAV